MSAAWISRVHARIVERDPRQVDGGALLGQRHDALLDGREHAEAEQVDLQEAGVAAGVLVPLADRAALHRGRLQRHHGGQRAVGDDHPAGVLGEVPRQPGDLARQRRQRPEAAVAGALGEAGQLGDLALDVGRVPAVGGGGEPRDVGGGQAEHLAELADRAARPVGGERADQRRVPVAVALVHAQDQAGADVAREVEVDVGHRRQLLVQEPAQRQPRGDRVDVRQAGQVADDRADAGAAAAAGRQQHPRRVAAAHLERHLARDLEHLVVQQEEARQPVAADQRELVVEPHLRLGPVLRARRVAVLEQVPAEPRRAPGRAR